jgi:hypothetical protein
VCLKIIHVSFGYAINQSIGNDEYENMNRRKYMQLNNYFLNSHKEKIKIKNPTKKT